MCVRYVYTYICYEESTFGGRLATGGALCLTGMLFTDNEL